MAQLASLTLKVTSSAFTHQAMIPKKYTCDGANINPPLEVEGIPANVQSLVLIIDDPDAPGGTWDHWVVWNIPVQNYINENSVPGTEGVNSFRQHHYGGPCPPSGTHRYFFKIYALDNNLDLGTDANKSRVEQAMRSHILAEGNMVGLYKRQ